MSPGIIHLLKTAEAADIVRIQAGLLRHGLALRMYSDVAELREAALRKMNRGEGHLILLIGSMQLNLQAAVALRRAYPDTVVACLSYGCNEHCCREAVRHGIDSCWPADAPLANLAATLQRLMPSVAAGTNASMSCEFGEGASWRLLSRAWVVQSPGGKRVQLTSVERCLVLALCSAPAKRLGHAELMGGIRAISSIDPRTQAVEGGADDALAARRLSVVVSRLRRKFQLAGLPMPIRSLHGQGYELSVQFEATDYGACVPA